MADKLDVLFIQSQVGFGADSAIHAHIMRYLDRERFTVHAACTGGDGGGKPASLAMLEDIANIRLRVTQFAPGFRQRSARAILGGVRSGLGFPRDFLALRDYVLREGIQVIHSTERPRDALYSLVLAKLTGTKSVVHVHVKWSNEYSRVARWGVRNADAVFAISRYVRDTIVGMGTPADRVFTVLNGIDVSKWDPNVRGDGIRREFSIPEGAPLLVSVSRLFAWKGQRELLRALALVHRDFPETRLLVVGADEFHVHGGSFTAELQELARELGVDRHVTFTGGRKDVAELLAASDLFTMPSYEEPFGLVFLEAMAMKKPVVALDNGGTPEVVEHEATGLLSPAWDVPAFAANVIRLLRDPELRARMGEAGRERVLERFSAERMAGDAGDAYREIAGR